MTFCEHTFNLFKPLLFCCAKFSSPYRGGEEFPREEIKGKDVVFTEGFLF